MLTGGGVFELTLRDESYSHLTLGPDVFTAALCRRLCTGRPVRWAESTAKREHRVLPGSLAWRSVGVLWLPNDSRFYCSAFSRTVNQTAAECGNQGGMSLFHSYAPQRRGTYCINGVGRLAAAAAS